MRRYRALFRAPSSSVSTVLAALNLLLCIRRVFTQYGMNFVRRARYRLLIRTCFKQGGQCGMALIMDWVGSCIKIF